MAQNQHLKVRSLNTSTAMGLMIAEGGYTIVHILTYSFTLNYWNQGNLYYVAMFIAEEIPNVFNFFICACSYLDARVPASAIATSTSHFQKALYYWKPVVYLISIVTLLVQLIPVLFGAYIWYKQDGKLAGDVAQETVTEAMSALLPFACSLLILKISMDFV